MSEDRKPNCGGKIKPLYGWIGRGPGGIEGIVAMEIGGRPTPLVALDLALIEKWRPQLSLMGAASGHEFRLVRFSAAEVLDELLGVAEDGPRGGCG